MRSALPPRPASPVRHGAGLAWLIIFLAVLVVAAVVFLAPDLPRRALGLPDRPADRGPDPEAKVVAKPVPRVDKAAVVAKPTAKPATTPAPVAAPTTPKTSDPVPVKTYADEAAAGSILAEARNAYRAFQWTNASLAAGRVLAMDVTSATRQRAKDIKHGATVLERLFASLNDPDELSRGYDTHPCLVEITTRGSTSVAVPVESIDRPIPVDKDPLAVIERQKREGKVHLWYKGRRSFSPVTLDAETIDLVKAVDLKPIIAQFQADLTARIEQVRSGDGATQPLAWYEAARFAYRNRLDNQVTDLMDQALELDPGLMATVREDRAATLLGHMLIKLKDGNKPQADSYLAVINKRFADTDSGKKAVAYYAGETGKLLALEQAAEQRRAAAEAARINAIRERENALGLKAATQVATRTPTSDTLDLAPVSGDELVADTMVEDGRKLCSKAIESSLGPDKNKLYKQAYEKLFKAKALYASLIKKNPGNESLQTRMITAGQYLYMAKKGLGVY